MNKQVMWLGEQGMDDVDRIGGKNASLQHLKLKRSMLI